MSSRKIYIILFFVIILAACSTTAHKTNNAKIEVKTDININEKLLYEEEDFDILLALEYQKNRQFEKSSKLFEKLFEKTQKVEYLFELIIDLYDLKKYEKVIMIIHDNKIKYPEHSNKFDSLLIDAYMSNKQYAQANIVALKLYESDQSTKNLDKIAKTYYGLKKYNKAYEFASKSYTRAPNEERVLNLSNLLYKHLDKKQEAIEKLEDFAKYHKCSIAICSSLLFMFNEQNDLDGTIKMLRKIYNHFKSEQQIKAQEQAGKMLVKYLLQKNDYLAMLFLEEEQIDDTILLQLYKKYKQIDKALQLMHKQYLKTANINIIAQMAILEFEAAEDKQKVLLSVVSKFKDALALVDNAMYQNYLGYLLIDYDVNIHEGITLVKLALEKEPENYAYLDSLAWGEYKLNNCKKAYKIMKKIVDEVGLKDEEIILHWNKIKECKTNDIR